MDSNFTAAQSLITSAMRALKEGDRRSARRAAEQAAALAPQIEQSWLILAYLAGPKAAQNYLEQALRTNPTSPRVLAALEWLKNQSTPSAPATAKLAESEVPAAPAAAKPEQSPSKPGLRQKILRYSAGFVVVAVLISSMALSSATRPPESQDATLSRWVQTVLNSAPTIESSVTPSLTSTPTQTETATPSTTATATASPSPTGTASPSPTSTSTSTATPTPAPTSTQTPAPTATATVRTPAVITRYTVKPGDSLYLIATRYNILLQDLVAANNLGSSLIMAGQVLTIPVSGQPPAALQPTATSIPAGPNGQGKEIQIDISEQHIYAYQDGKLVYSFVASTGIGNSTRIGTFKVLDKIPNAYSHSFNIWMPYWMGIYYSGTLENGIHGLPLLTNGVELWGYLLGKPATYGCIEARTSEIKKIYEWVEIGTPVIIRR